MTILSNVIFLKIEKGERHFIKGILAFKYI